MAYKVTYAHEVEMSFNYNGKSTEIQKELLKYMIIDTDYTQRIMPIIYLSINLPPSLYNNMVAAQGEGKIYLRLYSKAVSGKTSSVPRDYIYEEFSYYMSDDPNAFEKLDTIGEEAGQSYKKCIIGLMKTELISCNKVVIPENVFKNTNTISIVNYAASKMGTKLVIQPFTNNMEIDNFLCPQFESVGQFLSYVNSKYSFYNGAYIYFLDFDKTYIRSKDGKWIDVKDGDKPYIAFDIRDLTEKEAYADGIVVDDSQKAYIIYVDASYANIYTDRESALAVNSVMTVDSEGNITTSDTIDTSSLTNIQPGSTDAAAVYISDDPNAASASAAAIYEGTGTIVISKADMDPKIFTLNKRYILSNYLSSNKYNGIYYLSFKKEIYLRTGNQLKSQITLGLQKVGSEI